jgi:glutathione S-transferase
VTQLLLHHYPSSPFSEKIRAILGFKGLRWTSVEVPWMMPKPDVVALTGGYRKTPFLQIGADLYCDSALVADVLERLAPTPTLHPLEAEGATRLLAQWFDSSFFALCIAYTMQPEGRRVLFGHLPAEQMQAFAADRAAMMGSATPRQSLAETSGQLRHALTQLDTRLARFGPWLFGPSVSLADFSAYHPLWFLSIVPSLATLLEDYPRVRPWMDRMRAFGHGQSDTMTSTEAVALAARSTPAPLEAEPFLDLHGAPRGSRVRISATDYGTDAIVGELVVSRPNELALRRTDPRAGEVVVHFPRVGFQVEKVG